MELVSLERRSALQEYLLAVDSGEVSPPLPPHAEAHPKGFSAIMLPVQQDLKVHLAGQMALMQGTPLWRTYVGGLLPPELKRARDDANAAASAGTSLAEARAAGAGAVPDTPEERTRRTECIERIMAEAALMGDWKSEDE